MFKTTDTLIYGLTETQRILKEKIPNMQYYYIMEGTKKSLIEKYGFTKETSDTFIRITKVGWKCFEHDYVDNITDDDIDCPKMIEPKQFGWAVPINNVPDEMTIVLLEDEIKKCRFIESRSRTWEACTQSFRELKIEPTTEEYSYTNYSGNEVYYTRWAGPLVNTELTKERIDEYLNQCTIYDLILAMNFFKTSVERGKLSARDQWGR